MQCSSVPGCTNQAMYRYMVPSEVDSIRRTIYYACPTCKQRVDDEYRVLGHPAIDFVELTIDVSTPPYTKHTNVCLRNAKDDEPIFVLRAQDELAPMVVRIWANILELQAKRDHKDRKQVEAKIDDALDLATDMELWAGKHGSKLPD